MFFWVYLLLLIEKSLEKSLLNFCFFRDFDDQKVDSADQVAAIEEAIAKVLPERVYNTNT